MNHKRLFIPGPTEVRPEILQALSTPQIGHRSKEYSDLHERCVKKLQKMFNTDGLILIWTCASSCVMEGAVRNTCAKKCANFINGAFSKRWHRLTKMNGIPTVIHEVEMGKAIKPEMVDKVLSENPDVDAITVVYNETSTGVMSPVPEIGELLKEKYPDVMFLVDAVSGMAGVKIEPDKCGIDVVLAGVQKAFALPAGLTISFVSDKAMKKAPETIEFRGGYIDFIAHAARQAKNWQTPSTPSIPHMFALDKQMDFILQEGDARYERHLALAERVRKYVEEKWQPYTEKGYESNTVTNIANNRGISIADLNRKLGEEYMMISNGYGDLKEKCFRIAHMGDTQMWEIEGLLEAIERIIAANWPGK